VLDADAVTTMTAAAPIDRLVARQPDARHAPRSAAERRRLIEELEDPRSWPEAAAALLAELGYRLVDPEPGAGDDNHLLVALRDSPTERHFDPELVAYYAPTGRVAALATLDRSTATRRGWRDCRALWGHVHVVDRIPVENRFLTFGGSLRMAQVDPTLTVIDLWSPAPIVRWGGHSQATDTLAEAMGAFFGRLIVPVDFVAGAAERIDALSPDVLYRAFLIDVLDRDRRAARRGATPTPLHDWLLGAWRHAADDPTACAAARALLDEVGLGTPTA
jgi:hypothetical protein